jgi:hypothetical protein
MSLILGAKVNSATGGRRDLLTANFSRKKRRK